MPVGVAPFKVPTSVNGKEVKWYMQYAEKNIWDNSPYNNWDLIHLIQGYDMYNRTGDHVWILGYSINYWGTVLDVSTTFRTTIGFTKSPYRRIKLSYNKTTPSQIPYCPTFTDSIPSSIDGSQYGLFLYNNTPQDPTISQFSGAWKGSDYVYDIVYDKTNIVCVNGPCVARETHFEWFDQPRLMSFKNPDEGSGQGYVRNGMMVWFGSPGTYNSSPGPGTANWILGNFGVTVYFIDAE